MKIKDIINLTYKEKQKMNAKEVDEAIKPLLKSANRKLKEWRESEEENTYVTDVFLKDKKLTKSGNITTRGMNFNDKKKLLNDLIKFQKAKTSSVAGYKKVQKDTAKRIGVKGYEKWSEERKKAYWDVYNKYKERNPYEFMYEDEEDYENAIEVQNELSKISEIFTTKKGEDKKRYTKKDINKAVNELEIATGASRTDIEKTELGKEAKEKLLNLAGKGGLMINEIN